MKEWILTVLGFRKTGAMWEPDKRDYLASETPEEEIEFPDGDAPSEDATLGTTAPYILITLWAVNILNQMRTNRCTAYAMTLLVSIMLTIRLRKKIWINPNQLWKLQLKTTASESGGDTLRNPMGIMCTEGLVFNDYETGTGKKFLRRVIFKAYRLVSSGDERLWIDRGHPLYAGSRIRRGYVDGDGFWKFIGTIIGGHAYVIGGYAMNGAITLWYQLLNSWGRWWNGDGTAKIRGTEINSVFGPYVMTGMVIEDISPDPLNDEESMED